MTRHISVGFFYYDNEMTIPKRLKRRVKGYVNPKDPQPPRKNQKKKGN
jgi:hypothetical protein